MKNSTPNNNENLKKCPYESLIYGNKTDMVYRKQYKGDWGHWDDLSDNAVPCSNLYEANTIKNAGSVQVKPKTEN